LSVECFHTLRPLYRFGGDETVELHPEWAEYLFKNHAIVSGWAERRWISYLQSSNPMVPAVSEKMRPPPRRGDLSVQTDYWKKVIEASAEPPRCIYSDWSIELGGFDLDHFLPWTFVCHDALWNLIPAMPAANSAKGNRLPDRSFLPAFAAFQHAGLATARRIMSDDEWDTASLPFVDDLKIPKEKVLDAGALSEAYDRLLGAQMDVASATGFEPGWRYVT
jgi:hypothetical protein